MAKRRDDGSCFVLAGPAAGPEVGRTERNGLPVATFKKDIARIGKWKHPFEGWTLDVTPERMDRWVAAFKRMDADGIAVEVTQDHSFKDADRLGYIIGMEREGDTLYAIHEIAGEKNIALAELGKTVSPWIERKFIGGPKGQNYGEAIIHSSLCQQPVISGQDAFVEIPAMAASGRAASRVGVYTFAANQRSVSMDPKLLEVLQKLIGADESLTEDNAAEMLTKAFGDLTADRDDLSKMLTEAKGQVETLTKAAETKGDDKPPELSPDAEDMLVEGAEAKLEALVSSARITPACKKQLHKILIGEPGKRNVYALSRATSRTDQSVIRMVCAALGENDPVKLGEQSLAQAAVLSRVEPGKEDEPTPEQHKARINEAYADCPKKE